MTTEFVILAQKMRGRRARREFWTLPGCGNELLIRRTLRQLWRLNQATLPLLVTWEEVGRTIDHVSFVDDGQSWTITAACITLPEPGCSALQTAARYLEWRHEQCSRKAGPYHKPADRTVILLGDVAYSWACLEAALLRSETLGFVGTSALAPRGDLWAVAWDRAHENSMLADLRDALFRHPPFDDEYLPGQLRRWVLGWRKGDMVDRVAKLTHAGVYSAIDDYTTDFDTADPAMLATVSQLAAQDDAAHGLHWNQEVDMK